MGEEVAEKPSFLKSGGLTFRFQPSVSSATTETFLHFNSGALFSVS
jgi:hypothetical protein